MFTPQEERHLTTGTSYINPVAKTYLEIHIEAINNLLNRIRTEIGPNAIDELIHFLPKFPKDIAPKGETKEDLKPGEYQLSRLEIQHSFMSDAAGLLGNGDNNPEDPQLATMLVTKVQGIEEQFKAQKQVRNEALLNHAVMAGFPEVVKLLLERGADANFPFRKENGTGCGLLPALRGTGFFGLVPEMTKEPDICQRLAIIKDLVLNGFDLFSETEADISECDLSDPLKQRMLTVLRESKKEAEDSPKVALAILSNYNGALGGMQVGGIFWGYMTSCKMSDATRSSNVNGPQKP